MFKKQASKWEAWVSYTLNWSDRQFDELNNGKVFPAKYDRRHNLSIVGQYDLTERIAFSMVWEYISGSKFTAIIGQYAIMNPNNAGFSVLNIYTDRNAVSLAASHRLDLMMILKSKPRKKFNSEWHFGVYNAYNRATPIALNIVEQPDGSFRYEQPGIFGLIPNASFHFSF